MLLLALVDAVPKLLEWIDQYGADKVFMVLFMILYMRSQKKLGRLQESRLTDSKEALQALIEAKHVFGEMKTGQDEIIEKLRTHIAEEEVEFDKIIELLKELKEEE